MAEIIAQGYQTTGQNWPICRQIQTRKMVNNTTISGGSARHEKHEVFQGSDHTDLTENENEIDKQKMSI